MDPEASWGIAFTRPALHLKGSNGKKRPRTGKNGFERVISTPNIFSSSAVIVCMDASKPSSSQYFIGFSNGFRTGSERVSNAFRTRFERVLNAHGFERRRRRVRTGKILASDTASNGFERCVTAAWSMSCCLTRHGRLEQHAGTGSNPFEPARTPILQPV